MTDEENPRVLDSMALGFSLCGQHEQAVETQHRAISLLGPEDTILRSEMQKKLEKYKTALGESAGSAEDSTAAD